MTKKIPTGISNYHRLRMSDYYTVDKSLMIGEFLERGTQVTLITRPRRFGKTLNMSMMAEFFDITKDSKELFEGLAIMNTEYAKEMNQYPVIFLSFSDCKGNYEFSINNLFEILRKEYERYEFIFNKDDLATGILDRVRTTYKALCEEKSVVKAATAIRTLSELLHVIYNKQPMIFLDEYDTPFIDAHVNGYYEKTHDVFASIMRTSLKDNNHLQYAMITGIQRVAKENIFSDLNNIKVCSVKDNEYSQYFGFTSEETKTFLEAYGLELNDEVKHMYDGYLYGGQEIYNPWSIINYADEKELRPFWVNTSSNSMIKNAMKQVETSFHNEFETLIETGSLTTIINMETSFYEQANRASLWGLFVNAGYLTIKERKNKEYTLKIPNGEVLDEFENLVMYHLQVDQYTFMKMKDGLYTKQKDVFFENYEKFILSIPSFTDLKDENSFHMLMLGLCVFLLNSYKVISNREEGKGRCDLILKPLRSDLPSYVIEFKYAKKEEYEKKPAILTMLAQGAVEQIKDKKYDAELTGDIVHVGLAHSGKEIEMLWIQK